MEIDFDSIQKKLNKYNQEHLLDFYNELNNNEKEALLNQLINIDFEKINYLYKDLKNFSIPKDEIIEPIDYYIKEEFSDIEKKELLDIGENTLKQNNYAVVTMAGGQGTRLGHKGPKGTFELNLYPEKNLYLKY